MKRPCSPTKSSGQPGHFVGHDHEDQRRDREDLCGNIHGANWIGDLYDINIV